MASLKVRVREPTDPRSEPGARLSWELISQGVYRSNVRTDEPTVLFRKRKCLTAPDDSLQRQPYPIDPKAGFQGPRVHPQEHSGPECLAAGFPRKASGRRLLPCRLDPVCSDQMGLYAQVMPEFKKFNAVILGISVDGIWSHLAFAKERKLNFPLLSDFEPKGAVSRAYGAFEVRVGESARALFVIDARGMVRWSLLSPDGVNPGADGILSALEEL